MVGLRPIMHGSIAMLPDTAMIAGKLGEMSTAWKTIGIGAVITIGIGITAGSTSGFTSDTNPHRRVKPALMLAYIDGQ